MDGVAGALAPAQVLKAQLALGQAQLGGHLGGGVGQVGIQQNGRHAQALAQVVQHLLQLLLLALVLGQGPGRGLVNVLVGPLNGLEDLLQGLGNEQLVHILGHLGGHGAHHSLQVLVKLGGCAGGGHGAAEVLFAHGHGAAEQVAQVVGQVGVDAVDEGLVGEHTVVAEGDLTQQEVADGVHAVALAQDHRVHHVAHGLAHLAAVHQQPAMAEHPLGQGQVQRHQHGRPQNGVEAQNLLAHHVNVGGPELVVVAVFLVAVAQRGDVVAQGVHPHIHGVLGVKGNGNAPGHGSAGHAGVLQALLDEGDHLVLAAFRLDELRVLLIPLQQTVGVLAGLEEVGFLLGLVHIAAAVGALSVLQLAVGPEALAGLAVMALVHALVNVALVVQRGEDLLAALHMVIIGGADEPVIADVQQFPQVLHAAGAFHNVVHILLGGHAGRGGLILNLLAVLVGAGEEHHLFALQPLEAGQRIAGHGGVAVADVQLIAGIVNGGGDVERILIHVVSSFHRRPRMERTFVLPAWPATADL